MQEQYYSLNDSKDNPLDKKLDILFNHKTNGFYIELGAFDGITQSNSYFFELNRNWSGLLIEPSKNSYELCCKNRPNSIVVNGCCVSNDYTKDTILGDFNSTLMSSVNGNRLKSKNLIEVKAMTLEKILDDNHINVEIDFLVPSNAATFGKFSIVVTCNEVVFIGSTNCLTILSESGN